VLQWLLCCRWLVRIDFSNLKKKKKEKEQKREKDREGRERYRVNDEETDSLRVVADFHSNLHTAALS